MSARTAISRSTSMMSCTSAAMSRGGAPRAVRRRSAARRSQSKSCLNNASPRGAERDPSPAHASRASWTSPKAAVADRTPPQRRRA
eukprot:5059221-Pleurochrysis_carterae.AAC.2